MFRSQYVGRTELNSQQGIRTMGADMVMIDIRFEGRYGTGKTMHDVPLWKHLRFLFYCALVSAAFSFLLMHEAFSIEVSVLTIASISISATVGFGVSAGVLVYGPFITGMRCGYCRRSIPGAQEGYCSECEAKYRFSKVAEEALKTVDRNCRDWQQNHGKRA